MDNIYTSSQTPTSKDTAILNTIVTTLQAGGLNIQRYKAGPGQLYGNMEYVYNQGYTNAIIINLFNGVDPSNIREVATNGNDNRGRTVRSRGNDVILGWFWDACDFTRTDGTCYNRVRGSETGSGMDNPLQYCQNNQIFAVNQSSNNHNNPERADYTGEKIANAVLGLFEDSTTTDTETLPVTDNTGKTVASRTITKTYSTAYYEKVFQVKTDSNGVFKLKPSLPWRGIYKCSMRYGGDKVHNGTVSSVNLYNYDTSAKLFTEQLLETVTTIKYTDGTVDTNTTGSIGNAEHLRKEITTELYENGVLSSTNTKTINMDSVLEEAETSTYEFSPSTGTVTGTDGSPFETDIPVLSDGTPNITKMSHNNKTFANVDKTRSYTLTKEQYQTVMRRDSQTMQVNNYQVSKYTAFESTDTTTYNVLKREEWNIIEESIYCWIITSDGPENHRVFPEKIVVDFDTHNTYIYPKTTTSDDNRHTQVWKGNKEPHNVNMTECNIHWVGDDQYWGYTCGPTSCSVCTQVYHNFFGEYELKSDGNIKGTTGPDKLKTALEKHEYKATIVDTNKTKALAELDAGRPTVWHFSGHYIALTTRNKGNGNILICNSATGSKYTQDGSSSTGWHGSSDVKGPYGSTVLVDLKWTISEDTKNMLLHFVNSMGGSWSRPDTDEWVRRPNE